MITTRGRANGRNDRRADPPTSPERWVFRTSLAVLAVLLLLAAVGYGNSLSGGYLVLRQWFDRPLLLWTLGLPALLLAAGTAGRRWWPRVLLTTVVALLTGVTVLVWLFNATSTVVRRTEEAPGRTDRRLVEEETGWALDSTRTYYVDEGTGLTTRRWQIVHAGPYYPDGVSVLWAGPDRILVATGSGTVAIDLAADGRPSRELDL